MGGGEIMECTLVLVGVLLGLLLALAMYVYAKRNSSVYHPAHDYWDEDDTPDGAKDYDTGAG